jgi:hypothetical protein
MAGVIGTFMVRKIYEARGRPAPHVGDNKSTYADTRLRLQLDPAGTGHYHQVEAHNIYTWQQTFIRLSGYGPEGQNLGPVFNGDTVSIIFETAIEYDRPILNSFGHSLNSFNFFDLGDRGALFQFVGEVRSPILEIWFPPRGYYSSKAAAPAGSP